VRVLVIAAHPDDELLGVGGTILYFKAKGYTVDIAICGEGRGDSLDNKFDTLPMLRIIQWVEKKWNQHDLVLTHSHTDINIDHRIIAEATMTAFRPISDVKEIWGYYTPSSTEWNFHKQFSPNIFVNISQFIDQKIKMLYEQYPDEMREYPHPRSERAIRATAEYFGSVSNLEYAEVFELVRRTIG